jgi:hypothetical protein
MDIGLTRENIMNLVANGYVYLYENTDRQAFIFVEEE